MYLTRNFYWLQYQCTLYCLVRCPPFAVLGGLCAACGTALVLNANFCFACGVSQRANDEKQEAEVLAELVIWSCHFANSKYDLFVLQTCVFRHFDSNPRDVFIIHHFSDPQFPPFSGTSTLSIFECKLVLFSWMFKKTKPISEICLISFSAAPTFV